MEYSRKRYRKNNQQTSQGLGWIPDYPDLRDYNLNNETDIQNKLRFKTEEKTSNFEKFAQEVIKLFYDFVPQDEPRVKGYLSDGRRTFSKDRIDELKNKIFGNIVFADVRAYKILRTKEEPIHTQSIQRLNANDIKYESIIVKQITELRKYIFILFHHCPQHLLSEKIQQLNGNHFDSISSTLEWMKKENYDKYDQEIVKEFQQLAHITDDGIVGIETYITLNEYFDNPIDISKTKQSQKNFLQRFKFFSVSSFLSNTAFKKIIDLLLLDISKTNNQSLIQQWLLSGFDIGSLPEITYDKSVKLQKILKIDDLILAFKDCGKDDFKVNTNDVIEILRNSYVIEPIISVIMRFMSPLAKSRSLTFDELLEKCLNNFKDIAKSIKSTNKPINEQQDDHQNIRLGYSQQELVKSAVFKVISLIQKDIDSIIDLIKLQKENLPTNRYINTIYLYLLVIEYFNQFQILNDIPEDENLNLPNILDKEEVFEINIKTLNLNKNYRNDNNGTNDILQEDKSNLFPHLNLYLPIISNTLLQELEKCKQNASINQRLFFLLPGVIDLTFWFPPIRNQGSLNSCTAFAAISLLEYFEKKNFGKSIDGSPLFLYKVVRNKMNVEGDVGASIRETMKAMALFGIPPEDSWTYEEDKADIEPPPYCYAYAQNYKTLKYFFLDYAGIAKESLLLQIKAVLAAGFPCIFGFTIYTSAYERTNYRKGHIPYPDPSKDKVVGGHTAVVAGYDDYRFIRCADRQKYSKGAFLVRNSWGTKWGVNGYGWLPYDYVLAGLTAGWWSLLKADWFDESNFGPAAIGGGDSGDKPTIKSKP